MYVITWCDDGGRNEGRERETRATMMDICPDSAYCHITCYVIDALAKKAKSTHMRMPTLAAECPKIEVHVSKQIYIHTQC
jgi:hypothetical protein